MRATPSRAKSVHDRPNQPGSSPTSSTRATRQRRRKRANGNGGLNFRPHSCSPYFTTGTERVSKPAGNSAYWNSRCASTCYSSSYAQKDSTYTYAPIGRRHRTTEGVPASAGTEYPYSALLG
ncbi:hypothetical protein ON010_g3450 [Phytophthora cinnamomi]|nr:hypothetical protein ON010_g3450 [Phytophthora cinnamomi]